MVCNGTYKCFVCGDEVLILWGVVLLCMDAEKVFEKILFVCLFVLIVSVTIFGGVLLYDTGLEYEDVDDGEAFLLNENHVTDDDDTLVFSHSDTVSSLDYIDDDVEVVSLSNTSSDVYFATGDNEAVETDELHESVLNSSEDGDMIAFVRSDTNEVFYYEYEEGEVVLSDDGQPLHFLMFITGMICSIFGVLVFLAFIDLLVVVVLSSVCQW